MLTIIPIPGLGEILPGDPLGDLIADAVMAGCGPLLEGDVVVVTQKIVSKAEGRYVDLATVTPSPEAIRLAAEVNKDAALVELVLRESDAVVRSAPNVLLTRHRLGHVMANAGIDASNIGKGNRGCVLLLPQNPDASAQRVAAACETRFGYRPGVIVSDSFGRPWRMGTVNVAIGVDGMAAVVDQRGEQDRDGRELLVTQIALADAVAAAAGLVMGEGAEGLPAAIVRGLPRTGPAQTSAALLRPAHEDLFR